MYTMTVRRGGLLAIALSAGIAASSNGQAAARGFRLTSPTLSSRGMIGSQQVFNGMGCTGSNVSPALAWSGAPARTKSYAVTVYDPDAPTGSGWWHWVVYNIPASTTALPAGAGNPGKKLLPAGAAQGNTDFGQPGYGGPCPPQGDKPHRYIFTVYALDVDHLDIPGNATAAYVGFNLHGHTISRAQLVARYGR